MMSIWLWIFKVGGPKVKLLDFSMNVDHHGSFQGMDTKLDRFSWTCFNSFLKLMSENNVSSVAELQFWWAKIK